MRTHPVATAAGYDKTGSDEAARAGRTLRLRVAPGSAAIAERGSGGADE